MRDKGEDFPHSVLHLTFQVGQDERARRTGTMQACIPSTSTAQLVYSDDILCPDRLHCVGSLVGPQRFEAYSRRFGQENVRKKEKNFKKLQQVFLVKSHSHTAACAMAPPSALSCFEPSTASLQMATCKPSWRLTLSMLSILQTGRPLSTRLLAPPRVTTIRAGSCVATRPVLFGASSSFWLLEGHARHCRHLAVH